MLIVCLVGPGTPLLFLQHFTGTLDNWERMVSLLKTDSCGKQESKMLAGRFTVFKKFRI
jgi:hypothetical protein